MQKQNQIDRSWIEQMANAKPAVRGTTLITYLIRGNTDA